MATIEAGNGDNCRRFQRQSPNLATIVAAEFGDSRRRQCGQGFTVRVGYSGRTLVPVHTHRE